MRRALLLGVLFGCQDPDGNGAIEITGYLDSARVSWTRFGDDVQALGRDAAATAGATVSLENATSGDFGEALATELGAFLVSVPADDADRLVLAVLGAPSEDEITHDVPSHGTFPSYVRAVAHADPHDPHVAVVEVAFEPARDDGRIWVTNPHVEGAVVVLDTFDGGLVHGGHLEASEGDTLQAHWVPDAGVGSLAIEVPVGAPAP